AMFSFWRVVEASPKFSWHWLLTGALVGLGFLCKYTNALELVSIIAVLALNPKLRPEFRRPGFYLMLAVFIGLCIPPFRWHAQHAWITLAHLRAGGGLEQTFAFNRGDWFSSLGHHFFAYSRLFFLAIPWVFFPCWNVPR